MKKFSSFAVSIISQRYVSQCYEKEANMFMHLFDVTSIVIGNHWRKHVSHNVVYSKKYLYE